MIISNVPLNFFIVHFYSIDKKEVNLLPNNLEDITYFKIDYSFNYLKDIIDEITLINQESFFENDKYKIHNTSSFCDFFEISAIEGLKNKNFIPDFNKTRVFIRVEKINEICKYTPILREEIKNKINVNNQNDENEQIKYHKYLDAD